MERHVEDRHGLVLARLSDVRVRHPPAVQLIDGARTENREMLAPDHRRGVLIDAKPYDARILSDGRQQPAHPPTLGEVLVDEHAGDDAQSWSHSKLIADSERGVTIAADHHRLAHDARACRGAGNRSPGLVDLANALVA